MQAKEGEQPEEVSRTSVTALSAAKVASLPLLMPHLLLGLRTEIEGNCHFVTDDDILYPVGTVVCVHNFSQKRQRFIRVADKATHLNIIQVSPNRKVVAIAEEGPKPIITLWCLHTFKKRCTLTLPPDKEINATKYAALTFSFDSKFLYTCTGEPDYTLFVFRTERGRLESFARGNNSNGTGQVKQIAANPTDINTIAVIGNNLLRMLGCVDFNWRPFGYSKADTLNLSTAAWLTQDRLLCGTTDGRILFLESGDLKSIIYAQDLSIINLNVKDDITQTSSTSLKIDRSSIAADLTNDLTIRCLRVFPRGLVFGYLPGLLHLYEMESPQRYVKRNIFSIPNNTILRDNEDTIDTTLTQITHVAINLSQSKLMVSCNEHQLYCVNLWLHESSVGDIMCSELGFTLHNGPIAGMDVCAWKPLVLTAGARDRRLKLFNYETDEIELEQKWGDDIYSVALHPTGLYCLVAFSDKLRFFTIMIDQFVVTRQFPIRLCHYCSFSNLGYLFAAVNANNIQIYSCVTFHLMYILKGHSGQITGMYWSADDRLLASCGRDGAVYEWSVVDEKRISETVLKRIPFEDCVLYKEGRFIYAVSSDGWLREFVDSNVLKELLISSNGVFAICKSRLDLMMFVGGVQGSIYNLRLPILDKPEYEEYSMFLGNTTHLKMSFDDRWLLSASSSGELCFWKLHNIESKAIRLDKEFEVSTDILISRHILEEKLTQIKNLQQRLKELETEFNYQLRQNEAEHDVQMEEVNQKFVTIIEELKEKIEALETAHAQEVHVINMDIKQMKADHEEFVNKLEISYTEKLIFEYEKYGMLEEKLLRTRQNYDKEVDETQRQNEESQNMIVRDFLEKIQEKDNQIQQLIEQANQKIKIHETIKAQIEDDADREIIDLKALHVKELREEQDINVKLQGETSMLKKKLLVSQKEVEDLKYIVNTLNNEHSKFKRTIVEMEREKADMLKDINERDQAVQDKECRIMELKSKNQELEKFKFIMDFKIKELKSQIEPKDKQIQEQTTQINEMVRELENLQKVILNLDLQLRELREKLGSSDVETQREIEKNLYMKRELKKIKTEIYEASGFIQDVPKLKAAIKKMYHQFTADPDFDILQFEESEVRSEFARQRTYLEKSVNTLKRQVANCGSLYATDKIKLMEDNSNLLVETNKLRVKLKQEEKEKNNLQAVLGINIKYLPPKVAREKIRQASATREEIRDEYREIIEEDKTTLAMMKVENERLMKKLLDKEPTIVEEEEEDEEHEDQTI